MGAAMPVPLSRIPLTVDLHPVSVGFYVSSSTVDIATWSVDQGIVPVKLKRIGISKELWKETVEAAKGLWKEQVQHLEQQKALPANTACGKNWHHEERNVCTKTICCLAMIPCYASTCCEVDEGQIIKQNALSMNPRWLELVETLQPKYTPFGVDLVPFKLNYGGFYRNAGIRFHLPPDLAGVRHTAPSASPPGSATPTVEAEIMVDRGENELEPSEGNLVSMLERLVALRDHGDLTEKEFVAAKAKVLE